MASETVLTVLIIIASLVALVSIFLIILDILKPETVNNMILWVYKKMH